MKCIILYFSQSGNTKKIAFAIQKGIARLAGNCDISSIRKICPEDLAGYDMIGLGSPVWNGVPENVSRFIKLIPLMHEKHGFAFCTHGAKYGRFFPNAVRMLMKRGLTVVATRDWYGSVNHPFFPKPYFTDGHPDVTDLEEAEEFGMEIIETSSRISGGEKDLIPPVPPMLPPRTLKRTKVLKKLNREKCRYPECTLCMDHCRLNIIDLSAAPPRFPEKCKPCFFCEMICPEGAVESDYEPGARVETDRAKKFFTEAFEEAEKKGHFRRLVPDDQIGWDTPFYKVYGKHPRWIPED